MFHLFSKIYMDYDYNLEAGNRIIISQEFNNFVFTNIDDYTGYLAPDYQTLVDTDFGGDENNLWNFLISLPEDTKFVIYCDEVSFDLILTKYFRALFPSATTNDMYTLYRLTINKFKLMHSQIAHEWTTAKQRAQNLAVLSQQDFNQLITTTSAITPFDIAVKNRVSMEYLIAAYLSDPDSLLAPEFISRTEKMIWKNVAWEINEFKRNILNGFYDLGSLYPELSSTMQFGYTTLDDVIAIVPQLSFLQDIDCHPDNIDYIKETYDVADIFQAYYTLLTHIHSDAEAIDGFLRAHAHYTGTLASVFNTTPDEFVVTTGDMGALLDLDVNTNFGTMLFARTEYRKKMNPHVISYFYHLKRTGDTTTLDRFVAA